MGYEQLAEDGFAVLGERLRSAEERAVVGEVLEKVLGAKVRRGPPDQRGVLGSGDGVLVGFRAWLHAGWATAPGVAHSCPWAWSALSSPEKVARHTAAWRRRRLRRRCPHPPPQLNMAEAYQQRGDAPLKQLRAALEQEEAAAAWATEACEQQPPPAQHSQQQQQRSSHSVADVAALRAALGGVVWTASMRRLWVPGLVFPLPVLGREVVRANPAHRLLPSENRP